VRVARNNNALEVTICQKKRQPFTLFFSTSFVDVSYYHVTFLSERLTKINNTFMIKKFLKPLLVTLSLAVFTSSALAGPIKSVATVDMKKLFDEYHLTKGAQRKVKENQAAISKENNEKLAEIRKVADKIAELSKLIDDGSVAPKLKEKHVRERTLQANKGNALENNRREWLGRRNKAINENIVIEMRKILAQIQDKVETYARDNDVDMIFDKSARGTTQTHFLSFSKDQFDITSALLETLNKGAVPAPAPKTP
jgi:outer membrane protein